MSEPEKFEDSVAAKLGTVTPYCSGLGLSTGNGLGRDNDGLERRLWRIETCGADKLP